MPIVLKGKICSMKLNGFDNSEQDAESEKHVNGTDDDQNSPSGVHACDGVPKCSLCEMTFDSLKDYETHSISLDHLQRVLARNSLIALSSDALNIITNTLNQSEKTCINEKDKQEQEEESSNSSKTASVFPKNEASNPPEPSGSHSCNTCRMKFSGPTPYRQHLESKSHRKKIALENNALDEIKRIDGIVSCDTCKMEFSGEKPYSDHLVSKKHKRMVQLYQYSDEDSAPKAKKEKIELAPEGEKQWFCKICRKQCNGPVPYKQHLASYDHKKKEDELNTKPFVFQLDSTKTVDNSINNDNIAANIGLDPDCSENMEKRVQFLKDNSDEDFASKAKKLKTELAPEGEKQLFCKICRIYCSGPIPYKQHLAGNDHKKKEAWFKAGINIEPSSNQQYPNPTNESNMDHMITGAKSVPDVACSDNIANKNPPLEKIGAKRVEKKMEISGSKPPWFCIDCNIQCSGPINFSQHLVGKSHKKKINMYQRENNYNKPEDTVDFDGTKSVVIDSTAESSLCFQKQMKYSENKDFDGELKKTVKIYSPGEDINFD